MAEGGESGQDQSVPRLTITGERLTPERAELLSQMVRGLGYAAIYESSRPENVESDEIERKYPVPPIEEIVHANRLIYNNEEQLGTWSKDDPKWSGYHMLYSLLIDRPESPVTQYVKRDVVRAVGVVQGLALHNTVPDRRLAADLLNATYLEAVRTGRLDEARSLHGLFWSLREDHDEHVSDSVEGGLVAHISEIEQLIEQGRDDLRPILENLYYINSFGEMGEP